MSYEPRLAAALSGATIRQLAHWRSPKSDHGPILVPELGSGRTILYSFRDVMALRTFVKLRQKTSLQRLRKALSTLRVDLAESEHLSEYRLVSDGTTIYLADPEHAVDLVAKKAHLVIADVVDVLAPFYRDGRHIPALLKPRDHLRVDPAVRGGEPVIVGTRIPFSDVASLIRDGVTPQHIGEFYPGVSAQAAEDAEDFAAYVDSYSAVKEAA